MRFRAIEVDARAAPPKRFPTAVLRRDRWDDYGFKTTAYLTLHMSEDRAIDVGDVKILRKGQKGGSTPLPEGVFRTLTDDYCSLGQAFSYYETLIGLGEDAYAPLLAGLKDVVVDSRRLAAFEDEPGFQTSLLRTGGAELALKDAPSLFKATTAAPSVSDDLRFSFKTQVGAGSFVIDFDFGGRSLLPGRINVIIGYNGTGKTRLLANLAMVTYHAGDKQAARRRLRHGRIIQRNIRFGAVVTVSYSAFDTFELPGRTDIERERLTERGDVFGHVYCGLRTYAADQDPEREAPRGLKTIDQIGREFANAIKRATGKRRRDLFIRAMRPLAQEPSFNRIGVGPLLMGDPDDLLELFDDLSAGHKIVVNVVAQLVAHLEKRSLVLLDEPESHLHPPLLAALLKSVRIVLEDQDSFAIIATHSPVVLQETPSNHVRVLRRFDDRTVVAEPEIETFGENIGLLTRQAFSLDSSATDFHEVLERLARDRTSDEIESLFGGRMSSQARAFVLSLRRQSE